MVATTASPLPDLLDDGGLFVDPSDEVGWETALRKVLDDGNVRRRMREAGLVAAGRLTWEAAARQMIRVFQHVAAS